MKHRKKKSRSVVFANPLERISFSLRTQKKRLKSKRGQIKNLFSRGKEGGEGVFDPFIPFLFQS